MTYKIGDRVTVTSDCSDKGRSGKVHTIATGAGRYTGHWVMLDGDSMSTFFYLTSVKKEETDKVEEQSTPEHIFSLSPEHQEVYHAAVALSEAQERFKKALEKI